ncbi:hypothetical protein CDL12_05072 [Handroanthus impetiginosus]|uniref:Uncharacterized protein n=1 Tax=Handroanthus impetiginosus TaxID=429701 RepID=A0A2G9HXL7_9LAMI|nr:hypothetical protein CDL12_05072 [Handroanthus impetiginosus]
MTSNSIFTSAKSEKKWVVEIANNFPKEHIVEIDFDTPFCVFKVPKTLAETKPEAYTPQKMGLGPYHHLRSDLYTMEKQKRSAVRKFMNQENLNNVHKIVESLIHCEPVIRACYDQYLDLDANTLAWIVAVDGLYLLQFLKKYSRKNETAHDEFSAEQLIAAGNSRKSCDDPEIVRDIVMLENQIPAVLLQKILHGLQNDTHELFEDFDVFCGDHLPLELSKKREILQDKNQEHLLHRMYHLIVNNDAVPLPMTGMDDIHDDYPLQVQETRMDDIYEDAPLQEEQTRMDDTHDDSVGSNQRSAGIGIKFLVHIVLFLIKVPWDKIKPKIKALFKKHDADEHKQLVGETIIPFLAQIKALLKKHDPDEQNQLVEEINIPSVTQMSEIAGITFHVLDPGGIRNTDFDKHRKKFHLPAITIDVHTETVLRNLVAFELSKPGSTHEFASYVDLMCGIIDTEKDVEILKNANILTGELPDDEIVRIFNGIRRSMEENDKKSSNIKEAVDNVNEKYDDVWSVKVLRFIKKYFFDSWKYMRVVFSVVVVVMLTLQAFCSMFGCARSFGGSAAMKGGHFLYADS